MSRTLQAIATSRFYITFFLIFTFIALVVIPDLIYLLTVITHGIVTTPTPTSLVLYHISFLSDAAIYIFLEPDVRALLLKTVKIWYFGTDWRTDSVYDQFKRRVSIGMDLLSNAVSKPDQQPEAGSNSLCLPISSATRRVSIDESAPVNMDVCNISESSL